jgi:hypothetical protein
MDDDFYKRNSDIVDGLQFSATLQIRTPLSILQRHGEIFRGPPSEAPQYGTMADGIWTMRVRLGGAQHEYTYASDIGPTSASYYLPFLIEFRKIVESPLSHDQMLQVLRAIPTQSLQFKDIWEKLASSYEDFPASFFYRQFTKLPGVGRKTARSLYEAGFLTLGHIKNEREEVLARVPGLGKATAKKIAAVNHE